MTDASSPVLPGDRIAGKYRVEGVLGVGGMGVVVAAVHEQLDQKVALKFLLPEVLMHPDIVARFVREARAAVKIHSEHVARVLDVGTLETGAPYIVMEHLQGEDLKRVIERRGPLPAQEAVGYVLEVCEAIAEAHALGIVHRDLKPANLFLATSPRGRPIVKVLDFGISKLPLSEKDQALTKEASMMGSPAYMSPEQLRASRDVDARSDLWSMGVVLHEVLTGKLPFDHDALGVLVAAIMHDPFVPSATARSEVPAGLQAVIERCLEKDPALRYQNIAELARALCPFGPPRSDQALERIQQALGHVAEAPAPPTPLSVLGSAPQMEGRTFAPTSAAPSRPRRRLLLPALLGVAAVVAAAALVVRTRGVMVTPPGPASSDRSLEAAVAATPPSGAAPPSIPSEPPASVVVAAPTAPAAPAVPSAAEPPVRARARAGGARPVTTPTCKVVSYFDGDGNKHFKQECR